MQYVHIQFDYDELLKFMAHKLIGSIRVNTPNLVLWVYRSFATLGWSVIYGVVFRRVESRSGTPCRILQFFTGLEVRNPCVLEIAA